MVAMANAQSKGLVIIGVTKEDEKEGVGELKIEKFINNLQQSIDSNSDPWIHFLIKEFELLIEKGRKRFFLVSILANKEKHPYMYRKGSKLYEIPLRRGDNTKWLSPKEIREFMFELQKNRSEEQKSW